MTTAFWVGAAMLALLAAVFLLVPLMREHRRSGTFQLSGLVAAVVLVPVAFALYLSVTTYDPDAPLTNPASEELALLQQLADKMQRNPDDVDGWLLLGRSYLTLEDYGRARMALEQAWNRIDEPDNDLKLSYAESMLATERATASGLARDLIEQVLASDPDNQNGLWLGGMVAAENGRTELALERFNALLATNPPANVQAFIRDAIASLGGAPAGAVAPSATGPVINLAVSVADSISLDRFGPEARLYILARGPDMPMPLAAIQQPLTSLPGQFSLSDANSPMATGRTLGQFDSVTVIARISASGTADQQPGDLYAEAMVAPGLDETVQLVIDQIVPEG